MFPISAIHQQLLSISARSGAVCRRDGDREMTRFGPSPVRGAGVKAQEDRMFAQKPGDPLCATVGSQARALSQLGVQAGQLSEGDGNVLKGE